MDQNSVQLAVNNGTFILDLYYFVSFLTANPVEVLFFHDSTLPHFQRFLTEWF